MATRAEELRAAGWIGSSRLHGPWQRIERDAGFGWTVVAEEVPLPCNSVEWSVSLLHGETRIPPGPNMHRSPDAEMARLFALVNDPVSP